MISNTTLAMILIGFYIMKVNQITLGSEIPFTQIPNEFIRNPNISAKAKGLMCYLWSNRHDWVVHKKNLQNFFKDGRDSLTSAWNECKDLGYILEVEIRNDKGQFKGYNYIIYHVPFNGETEIGNTDYGKPEIGKPVTNNTILNKTINNNTILNNIPKNQKNDFKAEVKINEIEVIDSDIIDPFQISILDQIEEKEKKSAEDIVEFFDESSVVDNETFSKEVLNCYRVCLDYFDEHLHPKKPKTWYSVIDKLNRIDGIPFSEIERITKLTREDDFWSKNFLSLTKLRMKNKEKIPYIVVFSEKFKEKPKTINRQSEQTIKNNLNGW